MVFGLGKASNDKQHFNHEKHEKTLSAFELFVLFVPFVVDNGFLELFASFRMLRG